MSDAGWLIAQERIIMECIDYMQVQCICFSYPSDRDDGKWLDADKSSALLLG